jgi:UDP-glucose 4-epimerase
MNNILITGAAGNIGSSLVHKLIRNKDLFIVAVDNLSTGFVKNLPQNHPANYKFYKCDVNQSLPLRKIASQHQFDYIFHYAAMVGVERTLARPLKVLRDIDGLKNIIDLAKNHRVKRIFFSSSSEVYGESFHFPQHEETTPLNSRLPYAVVKNAGEAFLKAYHAEFGLSYTIMRFFNTYGPTQTCDFVIPRFIKAALEGRDIPVRGKGTQTRTFCYIDDNIDFTDIILRKSLFENEVVNVGNDNEHTITDLAKLIREITGSRSKIVHLPALPEGDMTRRKPDLTRMKSVLKRELISLEEGVTKMVDIFKQNNHVS